MRPSRQGVVSSAGVLDRGKGTGWAAWEPEMSHSRPRESDPATGIAGRTMILARCGTSTRSGALAAASTNRGGNRVGTGSETNKRPVMRRVGVVAPS